MDEREWLASTDPQRMLAALNSDGFALFRHSRPSNRQLRLFACACCWAVWGKLSPEARDRLTTLEFLADDQPVTDPYGLAEIDPAALARTEASVLEPLMPGGGTAQAALLRCIAGNPFRPATLPRPDCPECGNSRRIQAGQLDCPYCQCSWLAWRDGAVARLAEAVYQEWEGVSNVEEEAQRRQKKGGLVLHDEGQRRRSAGGPSQTAEETQGGRTAAASCRETLTGRLDAGRLAVLADMVEEAGCTDPDLLGHLRGRQRCPKCLGTKVATAVRPGYPSPRVTERDCPCGSGWVPAGPPCPKCRGTGGMAVAGGVSPECDAVECDRCSGTGRLPAVHVRGCWVVDLLTGRS